MSATISMLDVVAVTSDVLDRGLVRGQVGTVVDMLAPGVYEIEFANDAGETYAEFALREDQLIVLHYEPHAAASP